MAGDCYGEEEQKTIDPASPKSLLEVLAKLEPLDEDFPPILGTRPDPVDL